MATAPAKKPAAKPTAKPAAKTAAKPAGKSAPKAAAAAVKPMAPKPVLVTDDAPVAAVAQPVLKVKDLVERVSGTVSVKKKDIREVVDATLAALGAALEKGENLNLPPLGKANIARQRDGAGGTIFMVKLRRSSGKPGPKETLADTGDNS